jgi:hypothetical protein
MIEAGAEYPVLELPQFWIGPSLKATPWHGGRQLLATAVGWRQWIAERRQV